MNLPTWTDCDTIERNRQPLTPLEQFILDNEPAGPDDMAFRNGLLAAIEFVMAVRTKKAGDGAAPRATKRQMAHDAIADQRPEWVDPILRSPPLAELDGKVWKGTGRRAQGADGELVELGTWVNPSGDILAARLTRETGVPHAVDPRSGDVVRAGGGQVEIAPTVVTDPGTIVADPYAVIKDDRPVLGASARLPQPTHRIA